MGPVFRIPRLLLRGKLGQERVSMGLHHFYLKFYRILRPYVLWRVSRRYALPKVDFNQVDLFVIVDSAAIPIGWHLARMYPKLRVVFALDRSLWPSTEPAPQPTG